MTLTFASGKKNPDFFKEKQLLEELLGRSAQFKTQKALREEGLITKQGFLVAGARNYRWRHSVQVTI